MMSILRRMLSAWWGNRTLGLDPSCAVETCENVLAGVGLRGMELAGIQACFGPVTRLQIGI